MVPVKGALELTRPEGFSSEVREGIVYSVLHPWKTVQAHTVDAAWNTHTAQSSFFLNGEFSSGKEHCTGISIPPWVSLKWPSRRAVDTCHWIKHLTDKHHPSTWDKSNGLSPGHPNDSVERLLIFIRYKRRHLACVNLKHFTLLLYFFTLHYS